LPELAINSKLNYYSLMRVVATAEAIPRGKDITPKDATLRIKGRHRASYLGLFDGHGVFGV
jgi:hypothetical protein